MNKNSGIVLVHEMGHYFGLYHTFEGGCSNSDCTLSGDKVCDTPPDQTNTPVLCNTTVLRIFTAFDAKNIRSKNKNVLLS